MPNKQLTGDQVRQMFLDFFATKGHMIFPSASLIPHNDPTLLWINAGVAPLKKYFDGTEKPQCPRIANAQKSIRTNDIENVGKTSRHHTFFEMLGNFSIGDYFKKEAIPWAWEFLTSPEWIGFDKSRMYVTIYPDDEEALALWHSLDIDPSHIRKTYDNFWEIGRGPGGPDSEIYYDRGPEFDPQGIGDRLFFEDIENDRYIEVWNVVFSQYDCRPDDMPRTQYQELPQKNIDTGMGLERLVCLIQGGETNFDTDLFLPVIQATEKLAKHPYSDRAYKMAYRVIADHIRTVTFALADGASFSNDGRGYVLRRVLRRAVRYGIKLGIDGAFMYSLVQVVADMMKGYYPYLQSKVALVSRLVKNEEESFHKTLANGEALLNAELENYKDTKQLSGAVVFKLYDTYGFPKELTAEIAEEKGYTVDLEGFEKEMQIQKERARNARGEEQSMHGQSEDLMNFETPSEFTGYTDTECTGKVTGLFIDGVRTDEIGDEGDVILDRTCFYAESGGQTADTGKLYGPDFEADVVDVRKAPHNQHMHHIRIVKGSLKEGDTVEGCYDVERRQRTRANHTSLHLLQAALIKLLGDHVGQAGSYNGPDYARFDFNHFEKVTAQQLREIERMVNEMIAANVPVTTEVLPVEEAKNTGAIALFDEKYGDTVRVVTIGEYSKELCGGTHAADTGDLGLFKIVSEESIGSGIRRITCVTKMKAYEAFRAEEDYLNEAAAMFRLPNHIGLKEKIEQQRNEIDALRKEVAEAQRKAMNAEADHALEKAEEINGLNVLFLKVKDMDAQAMKDYADMLRGRLKNSVIFLTNAEDDKVTFVGALSKAAVEKGLNAGTMVRTAAAVCGGKGGGRPDLAQAGGRDTQKVPQAIEAVRELIG